MMVSLFEVSLQVSTKLEGINGGGGDILVLFAAENTSSSELESLL